MTTDQHAQLLSIRKRIQLLRSALEDETLLTEISIDGVGEKLDRAQAVAELKDLELQEARLTGARRRITSICLN